MDYVFQRKCEPYWPDNVHDVYNPPDTSLSVSYEELQVFADYEIKKLVVTNVRQLFVLSYEVHALDLLSLSPLLFFFPSFCLPLHSPSPSPLSPQPSDSQSSPLTVTHYQFLSWPDHGVPKFATSFIAFVRRVRSKYTKGAPPMVVHCSAGVGRTGVFIVLDSTLERMQHKKNVNVYEFVRSMRAKRIHMVRTQVSVL